eukprot:m.92357 g.92357  ORF g.92357 m.92357 type:complete len:75 (-) comp12034_c0_seq2:2353-2577(-)
MYMTPLDSFDQSIITAGTTCTTVKHASLMLVYGFDLTSQHQITNLSITTNSPDSTALPQRHFEVATQVCELYQV